METKESLYYYKKIKNLIFNKYNDVFFDIKEYKQNGLDHDRVIGFQEIV